MTWPAWAGSPSAPVRPSSRLNRPCGGSEHAVGGRRLRRLPDGPGVARRRISFALRCFCLGSDEAERQPLGT